MPTTCFTPLKAKTIRVTELTECGCVPEGALYVVSKGFTQVTLSAEVETGVDYFERNADGDPCVDDRDDDILKRHTAAIDWCGIDPDIISLTTGNPLEVDGTGPEAIVSGYRGKRGALRARWALEMWIHLGGSACDDEGNQCYAYFLLPFLAGGYIDGQTFSNARATFQTTGSYTKGGDCWGVGPYSVIGTPEAATPLTTAMAPDEDYLHRITCVPPPEPSCGAQVLTSPASVAA